MTSMDKRFYILFDTVLGRCGLAWGKRGVLAASFADENDDKTRARLLRRAQGAQEAATPPAGVETAIADIQALFQGEPRNFADAQLDLEDLPEFDCTVYDLTLKIKPGETKTYGELARSLGDVSLSRRVGQALGRNPIPIIVPCHRVVGADGAMTGFSAPGGTVSKRKLLKIEGALAPDLFD